MESTEKMNDFKFVPTEFKNINTTKRKIESHALYDFFISIIIADLDKCTTVEEYKECINKIKIDFAKIKL